MIDVKVNCIPGHIDVAIVPERVLRSDAVGTADIVAAESAIIVVDEVAAAVVAAATTS